MSYICSICGPRPNNEKPIRKVVETRQVVYEYEKKRGRLIPIKYCRADMRIEEVVGEETVKEEILCPTCAIIRGD